jgi:hypothetical protein
MAAITGYCHLKGVASGRQSLPFTFYCLQSTTLPNLGSFPQEVIVGHCCVATNTMDRQIYQLKNQRWIWFWSNFQNRQARSVSSWKTLWIERNSPYDQVTPILLPSSLLYDWLIRQIWSSFPIRSFKWKAATEMWSIYDRRRDLGIGDSVNYVVNYVLLVKGERRRRCLSGGSSYLWYSRIDEPGRLVP